MSKEKGNREIKVFEIHSYEEDFPWTQIVKRSFENRLRQSSVEKVLFFDEFLKVKKMPVALGSVHPRQQEILDRIDSLKPDIVLLTDDYALTTFVEELTKRKMRFVFAGINGDLPTALMKSEFKSYSGVFERYYVKDSVKLLQRVLGKKKLKILLMLEESEVGKIVHDYAKNELRGMTDIDVDTVYSNEFEMWKKAMAGARYDAYLPLQPYSLIDSSSKHIEVREIVKWFNENSKRPTVFTSAWHIKCGGTLAIVHRPESQGIFAAEEAKKILNNETSKPLTPPHGDIEFNHQSALRLGIKIPFDLLTTANVYKKTQVPCTP